MIRQYFAIDKCALLSHFQIAKKSVVGDEECNSWERGNRLSLFLGCVTFFSRKCVGNNSLKNTGAGIYIDDGQMLLIFFRFASCHNFSHVGTVLNGGRQVTGSGLTSTPWLNPPPPPLPPPPSYPAWLLMGFGHGPVRPTDWKEIPCFMLESMVLFLCPEAKPDCKFSSSAGQPKGNLAINWLPLWLDNPKKENKLLQ